MERRSSTVNQPRSREHSSPTVESRSQPGRSEISLTFIDTPLRIGRWISIVGASALFIILLAGLIWGRPACAVEPLAPG